ncbi:MAG: adenylate/guanylate cyclase domain-containing protein [Rhodocyclales bacterium GT-UBC]|nr:MAG: adenylate/guanylate cyclase domain-containing protein [Rhodocyclales bacterium GT-UBC]
MSSQQRKLFVMFADVSGSARLFERLGDTEAMHAVERCLKRMNRSIDGYRGHTVQIVGDELLAAFESAEDACQASIDMQQRIADLPPVSGLKLTIRIGLHVGLVTEESDGQLSGEVITTAARIVGTARRDQILASSHLIGELPKSGSVNFREMPDLEAVRQNDEQLKLFLIEWVSQSVIDAAPSAPSIQPPRRLCVRYRGKAHLLDDKTPVLTLGRDLGNKLQVEDRKASRLHARIERRSDGYYLVDTSTNGTFVCFTGKQEIMIRRHEILLEGNGGICFGTSRNDPTAEIADFEHL